MFIQTFSLKLRADEKQDKKKRQLTLFPVPLLLFLCQLFHEGHHVRLFRSHHLPDDQNHKCHCKTEKKGGGNTWKQKTLKKNERFDGIKKKKKREKYESLCWKKNMHLHQF